MSNEETTSEWTERIIMFDDKVPTNEAEREYWQKYKLRVRLGYNECFCPVEVHDYHVPEGWSLLVSGDIRFDGCANLSFHTSKVMAHFCGCDGWLEFNRSMVELFRMAYDEMPSALGDCFALPEMVQP